MLIKKLDVMFVLSAFSMWVIAGLLSYKVQLFSVHVLNGLAVTTLLFIPLVFLIVRLDKAALPQICITTVLLGAGVGFFVGLFTT